MAPLAVPELLVADVAAFRAWLIEHHDSSIGVWLVLARLNRTGPTSLTYDEALNEALCFGWIDGQKRSRDSVTFGQRFTHRRTKSSWSKRNVGIAERLTAEGRMTSAGQAEIDAAKADGRWEVAYSGMATAEIPDDLKVALAAEPAASQMFDILTKTNRYSVLYRIETAKLPATRARRVEQLVAMLARGETIHPQKAQRSG